MLTQLRDYFRFSATEKKGVLALSSIVLVLMLFIWFRSFQPKQQQFNNNKFNQQIAQFYEADSLKQEEFKSRYKKNYPKKYYPKKHENKSFSKPQSVAIKPIDINFAEAQEFQQIKGIGEVLAQRIIQYRQKLGGFYSINQLKEVYGIKPELINENTEHFFLSQTDLNKLDINTTEFKTLLKHPYLEYNDVKKIFRLKDSLKTISLQDVQRAFPDTLFTKVSPYLK